MVATSAIGNLDRNAAAAPQVMRHLRASSLANRLRNAQALVTQGEYDAAATQLERLLVQHPRHAAPTHMLASVYISSGGPQDALNLLRDALQAHPDDLSLHRVSYRAAATAGDEAGMEASLAALARLDPLDGKS